MHRAKQRQASDGVPSATVNRFDTQWPSLLVSYAVRLAEWMPKLGLLATLGRLVIGRRHQQGGGNSVRSREYLTLSYQSFQNSHQGRFPIWAAGCSGALTVWVALASSCGCRGVHRCRCSVEAEAARSS
jgi:hypothetical protein